MQIEERKSVLSQIGNEIREGINGEWINAISEKAHRHNSWFTIDNSKQALLAIADKFLSLTQLAAIQNKYSLGEAELLKSIGIVLAGNIPAVGFHDFLCVFLMGQKAIIKLSSKDNVIIPALIDRMTEINPAVKFHYQIVERMKEFDAVIATGGNNTSRYFEYYFRNVPHLIRKSRSSVAVLTGTETAEDLHNLGKDIFSYFGLGCRNVSKIMVPVGYDLKILLKALDEFEEIAHHNKYKNNFDYSLALYLLNREEVLANNCIILRNDLRIASRIACLHYQYYEDDDELEKIMKSDFEDIQCVIGNSVLEGFNSLAFGEAQYPGILDFADGVDTIQFLKEVNGKN